MLTSRLKILPADKAFKRIITKDDNIKELEKYKGHTLKYNASRSQYFTFPKGGSGHIYGNNLQDLKRKIDKWNEAHNFTDANPDLINMYKQKFEEAIDNGDKEEMKRWFREIMNHVSFTDAEAQSGYDVRNIEEETTANDYFRKVIVTGKNLQLVLMSLLPNEDIGMEVHEDVDQFFRIDEGDGFCEIKDGEKTPIKDGSSIVIKAGTYHNIIAGDKGLKLYTIYAPPNYPPDREQKTKAEAVAEEKTGQTKDDAGWEKVKAGDYIALNIGGGFVEKATVKEVRPNGFLMQYVDGTRLVPKNTFAWIERKG
jgi:mannose-6-phosphate isomerase-like protein (cupin superfamily)